MKHKKLTRAEANRTLREICDMGWILVVTPKHKSRKNETEMQFSMGQTKVTVQAKSVTECVSKAWTVISSAKIESN